MTVAHTVAVLVDEADERPLELMARALAEPLDGLVVVAAVRRLGLTTDAALADRHALRREALVEHLAEMARDLAPAPLALRRRSLTARSAALHRTARRARRLARALGATALVHRDDTGGVVVERIAVRRQRPGSTERS
ncbi:hypothetical protein [Agrococcus sp. TF02-05]|uniref:hypothetical protein n=1 Tax=Agrococcus sp. TF02-05 TaxID=2815211 RepID=UPI001AA0DF64|nr:hypothetical protein [Agrococcus sp. TF02-05]MBO1770065.1 hypothetical protein [Agrococcus sp. TF02-05]